MKLIRSACVCASARVFFSTPDLVRRVCVALFFGDKLWIRLFCLKEIFVFAASVLWRVVCSWVCVQELRGKGEREPPKRKILVLSLSGSENMDAVSESRDSNERTTRERKKSYIKCLRAEQMQAALCV